MFHVHLPLSLPQRKGEAHCTFARSQILVGSFRELRKCAIKHTAFRQDENPRNKEFIAATTSALLMARDGVFQNDINLV